MTRRRDPTWAFAAAFAAVVASFLGATVVARGLSKKADAYARQVQTDTAPSVVHLASARTGVWTTEFLLQKWALQRPGATGVEVEHAVAAVRSQTDAYLVLPVFPDETPFWNAVDAAVGRFVAVVTKTLKLLAEGHADAAIALLVEEVGPVAQLASDALGEDVQFQSRNLAELAADISEGRSRADRLGDVLYALAFLVTGVAVVLLRRVMRATNAAFEANTRSAELRAEEFEAFSGRVAHDLLNPLGAAKLAVAVGLRGPPVPERMRGSLERASRSLGNAHRIIDGLLEFARSGGNTERGSSSLAEQVQLAMADLAERAAAASVTLEVVPLPTATVACSAGVLSSVISNLVGNAIKYMGPSALRRVQVSALIRGDEIRVEVQDTGPGLPTNLTRDEIFRMYLRGRDTHQPGLGLGLATVKRLVEGHGGRCGVDSEPGKGCRFWFELPLAPVEATG